MIWIAGLLVVVGLPAAAVAGYKIGAAVGAAITSLVYDGKEPTRAAVVERALDALRGMQ